MLLLCFFALHPRLRMFALREPDPPCPPCALCTRPAAAASSLGRRLSLGSGEVTLDCLESVDDGGEQGWAHVKSLPRLSCCVG